MGKRVSIDQAIDLIKDGDVIAISGFQRCVSAAELYDALGKRFEATGHPKGLTLISRQEIWAYRL